MQINTHQLILHSVVSFLFASCALPCCFLVRTFYGPYYEGLLIGLVVLCAISELGLLYIYNKISL